MSREIVHPCAYSCVTPCAYPSTGDSGGVTFDYYADATGGSDSNTGTSPDDAWQTISKINSSLPAGASLGFKYGEVFQVASGATGYLTASDDNNSFGAYGNSALGKPIIRNSIPQSTTGWAQDGTFPRIYNLTGLSFANVRAVWHGYIHNGTYREDALVSKGSKLLMIPGSY